MGVTVAPFLLTAAPITAMTAGISAIFVALALVLVDVCFRKPTCAYASTSSTMIHVPDKAKDAASVDVRTIKGAHHQSLFTAHARNNKVFDDNHLYEQPSFSRV